MFTKIVSLGNMADSSIWSAQYFSLSQVKTISNYFPLVSIREIVKERKETVNPQEFPFTNYVYVGLENIESSVRTLNQSTMKTGDDVKSTSKLFMSGDILYGRLRPNLNKVFLVDDNIEIGICSTEIIVLVPQERVLPEYLAEVILSDSVRQKAESLTRGASLPRVQVDDFLDIEIPLPAIDTQKEIVEFILYHRNKWHSYRTVVNEIPQFIQDSLFERLYSDKPLLNYIPT